LVVVAGGVVFPALAEVAGAYLAAGRELSPSRRGGLLNAARALAEGQISAAQFCTQAVEACGAPGEATADRLHEHLAHELTPLAGIAPLIADVAQSHEVRLVADYPAAWLLPALQRCGLAGCFAEAEVCYVADLGGFAGLFDALVTNRVIVPGHTLWVDSRPRRTSAALRMGVDATIFVDARRFRRDLALWRLMPLPT
jgi:hypothetical protein